MFNTTFAQISQWMNTVILRLAEHETEAVLITSRKRVEESCSTTFRLTYLKVVEQEITSEPFIRYLEVTLDARLNFKRQVEHGSVKASAVRTCLSRFMPNVGGPKQSRRLLPSIVVTSVLTYGISICADALGIQEARIKAAPIYCLSALRVARYASSLRIEERQHSIRRW